MRAVERSAVIPSSSDYESHVTAFLQERLRVLAGVIGLAIAAFYALRMGSAWLAHRALEPASPENLVHLASVVGLAAIYAAVRGGPRSRRTLQAIDVGGFSLGSAACVALFALRYDQPSAPVVSATLKIMIIARAVLVPSTARVTLLVSLPGALGVLAVLAAHGGGVVVLWNAAVFAFAIAVAVVASHVTHTLRRQVREARRMGAYRLGERIGAGAMGEVYRASHEMLRRPAAIKLLRPEVMGQEALARFEREVQLTATLTHPNTVMVYDYGRTPDGVFYYAMEHLDGADLSRVLEAGGPLPAARAIHVLIQACDALEEAHALGLVHRDIKPRNIILCTRGGRRDVVKIVDFGLVKDLAERDPALTRGDASPGTPLTMAPEVLFGEPATPQSDLYSLAVVGYNLVTNAQLYDFRNGMEFFGLVFSTPPIPPRERNPAVPEDLERVLLHGLARSAGDRPEGVAGFREELSACRDAGRWTEADAAAWWEQARLA